MAQTPFFWGRAGAKLTPDQVARERETAALLAKGAMDFSPVQHWTQGLGRVAQGILAGLDYRAADRGEADIADRNKALIASLLSGGSAAGTAPASSSIPMTSAAGEVAATAPGSAVTAPSGVLPSSFLSAVDATEGAGGYDTLFGNAQRGKFAGTDVSALPIRDVLAFTDPSGPYAQSVKSQIGRVATPVGRHQIVGTTLRNAVSELDLDPNAPFDAATQDRIALHLAKNRVASADTMGGKISALRSEWEGFRNVPDAQMQQIVADIEQAPVNVASISPQTATDAIEAVAPLQPTPEATMSFAGQERAPPVSLTDEVLAFQQTPEANAAFPGRANRAAAEPQLMTDFSGSNQLSNAQGGIIPALTGGIPASPEQIARAQAAAQAPIEVAGGGDRVPMAATGTPGINPAIIEALTDPQASPQTQRIAGILLEQQQRQAQAAEEQRLQAADPMRRIELESAQIKLDQLRNPTPGFRPLSTEEKTALGLPPQGSFQMSREGQISQIGGGGVNITNEGTIPAGYQAVRDAQGRVTSVQPLPGSPAALEMEQSLRARENQGGRRETATNVITNAATNARDILKNNSLVTGTPGKLASYISESPAAELRRQIGVLKSQATIETLTAMRQASPTGGALGAVSDKEGEMLAAAAGSIDPDAAAPDVEKALDNYERTLLRVIHGPKVGDAIFEQTRTDPNSVQTDIPGVKIRRKN